MLKEEAGPLSGLFSGPMSAGGTALQQTLPRVLRAIREHLGMDVAFISEFSNGRRMFRHVDADAEQGVPRVDAGDPLEDTYCQRIVDGRMPELIIDTADNAEARALRVTEALSIGSYLGVPLQLEDGRIYGTFCCFSFKPDHTLNERDVGMMHVVAGMVIDVIEHELAEDREQQEIREGVSSALRGDGLSTVYQPIMDLNTARPVGFEALARFSVTPARDTESWFSNAASIGRDVALEMRAVELAVEGFELLPADSYLALNVSPETLLSGQMDLVLADIPSDRLVLEITERAPIDRYDGLLEALGRYRQRGVRVAVDDAGAGYASFRHILVLQPDLIKLDKSLVRDIDSDVSRRALAKALIQFARKTGSALIAEGVETATELAALKRMGVTLGQGFYLGSPAPLEQAVA